MKIYIRSESNVSKEDLLKLVNDDSYDARSKAVHEIVESGDSKLIAKIAKNRDVDVRMLVAEYTDDPELLAKFAKDRSVDVRLEVAYKTDDPELLAQLANDKSDWVRSVIFDRYPEYKSKFKKHLSNWPDEDFWYSIEDDESFEDAWQKYLSGPETEVNKQYNIFAEPSVQGMVGSMFLKDESGRNKDSIEVDFENWCDVESDMASSSESASEYKEKYENYLVSLMEGAGWSF